jgi:acetyl esterase/lipase
MGDNMVERNISYKDTDGSVKKNTLDIYYERGLQARPVVIYIHGGAWSQGDKDLFIYLGEVLRDMGFTGVIINYRLTPDVTHPAHVEDCASAVAWVYKNIQKYGGNPENIFLCGHSSGAHLASLLALDEKYLSKHDVSKANITGVISLAGVYRLYKEKGENVPPFFAEVFSSAFGDDEQTRIDASPINHVKKNAVVFLILFGEKENRYMKKQSIDFFEALVDKDVEAEIRELTGLDHVSIVTEIWNKDSEIADIIEDFVMKEAR